MIDRKAINFTRVSSVLLFEILSYDTTDDSNYVQEPLYQNQSNPLVWVDPINWQNLTPNNQRLIAKSDKLSIVRAYEASHLDILHLLCC